MTDPSSPVPAVEAFKLLPCPFCGGSASFEEVPNILGSSWSVGCDDESGAGFCLGFQSMTTFPRKSEATRAWNTRTVIATPTPGRAAEPDTMAEVDLADGIAKVLGLKLHDAETLLSAVRTIVTRAETAEAQLATREWQDISTAPKDGTKILVFGNMRAFLADRVFIASWDRDVAGGAWMGPQARCIPRCWQPLPEPPLSNPKADR